MKRFALIGAAGYIAPRHMRAIRETGNVLAAAMDLNDSVGVLDNYFPNADFYTDIQLFENKLKDLDYLSICTPNHFHEDHIRLGLRSGNNIICEKPVVLEPKSLDELEKIEQQTGRKVFTIMQLRLHPSILRLKKDITSNGNKDTYDVELKYFTARGKWYHASWKGDVSKSGGIATNIGIHFFDLLTWIFGNVRKNRVIDLTSETAGGELELENAMVKWRLSIRQQDLPGKKIYRCLSVDGKEVDFTDNTDDLHTLSYQSILGGKGFTLQECRKSIELVHEIRNYLR